MLVSVDELLKVKGLHVTSFPDGPSFTWRLLTSKEYKVISALQEIKGYSDLEIYIKVFETAYLGDTGLIARNLPLGYILSVGQLCLYMSGGFMSEEPIEAIVRARNNYQVLNILEVMKRTILNAFPSYTLESLDDFSYSDLIYKYVVSEKLLEERHAYLKTGQSQYKIDIEDNTQNQISDTISSQEMQQFNRDFVDPKLKLDKKLDENNARALNKLAPIR